MARIESLASAQHELARHVTALEGPVGCEGEDGLRAWLRADRSIPASERVRIYANAYFARIHGVLRDDYGTLHAALGPDGFHDLAKLYLMAYPPRSFSLRFVGAHLCEFLSGPVAEPFSRRWPFAADLAALEWAIVDVFDAPDTPLVSRETLAAVPPEEWGELRFELITAHRLLRLAWPVQRMREAWDVDRALPEIERAATTLLVHRHGEDVAYRPVSALEADALALLAEGRDFGAVCARVAAASGEAEGPPRALGLLERWLADGILAVLLR